MIKTQKILSWKLTYPLEKVVLKMVPFEDGFTIPHVGYVSSLEGILDWNHGFQFSSSTHLPNIKIFAFKWAVVEKLSNYRLYSWLIGVDNKKKMLQRAICADINSWSSKIKGACEFVFWGGGWEWCLNGSSIPSPPKKSDILTQFHLKGGEKISSTSSPLFCLWGCKTPYGRYSMFQANLWWKNGCFSEAGETEPAMWPMMGIL